MQGVCGMTFDLVEAKAMIVLERRRNFQPQ
jgi:hypothetical protein